MTVLRIVILSILGFGLFGASGCGVQPPPPMDLRPFSEALRFLGVCSVLCSLIWGTSLIITGRRRNRRDG